LIVEVVDTTVGLGGRFVVICVTGVVAEEGGGVTVAPPFGLGATVALVGTAGCTVEVVEGGLATPSWLGLAEVVPVGSDALGGLAGASVVGRTIGETGVVVVVCA
jgi:hypothetical protein